MAAQVQQQPITIACPYTAGGCPLFSNLEVPASSRSACTGACSPAPSSPAPVSRPPPTQQKPRSPTPSSYTLPSISSAGSSSGLNDASIWSTYLDYDLAPELDLSTQYYASPAAHPLPSLPPMGEPSTKHGILDIEEMFSAKKSRVDLYEQQAPEQQQRYATIEPSALSSEEENEADTATPFISKLAYLLSHTEHQQYIRWSPDGRTIVIAHTKPELLDILSKLFRHSTVASFIRQLNIYSFKRLTTTALLSAIDGPHMSPSFSAADYSAFANPDFFRASPGHPCKLSGLKPVVKDRGVRIRKKPAARNNAKSVHTSDESS